MKLSFYCKDKAHLIISLALLTALAFITVLASCNKEDLQDGSIPDAISEYRTFYEEQMHSSETKGHSSIPRRSPKWEKATIQKWYRGYAAVTPLDYEENYFIRSSKSPYNMNLQASSFLMVNKGIDGSMQGEIIYLIPDGQASRFDKGVQSCFSGTIVTESLHGEFLAAYICQPNGSVMHYVNSEGKASLKKTNTKGLDCWTYELWQITSIDGGETWSDPTLISSHTECYYIPDMYYFEVADDYYDLGGGGGGESPSQSFRPLTADESEMLESVRINISQDCATNNVVNSVWSSLSFNAISSLATPAQYNVTNNTITFNNSSSINANAILEELFHAYQNTIYPGGIGQYSMGEPGFTNLEFEAKLFKDIYYYTELYVNGNDETLMNGESGSIGFPNQQMGEYGAWVLQIAYEGFTPTLMQQYSTMLGYFNQYSTPYGGYLLPDLDTPLAIIQSKYGCN
ncbi:MAG: hypothetical protein JRJ57_10815 [Deltaproteobacteria bacterium]|nr:hypothetical protein [Deltaproteobacteria bacterium]